MIKKAIAALLIGSTLTVSHYSSANLLYPHKVSHFNDDSLDGWSKGPRSNKQPEIKQDEAGQKYLEVSSTGELAFDGERDPDSRLRILNHSTWLADYDLLGIVALKVRMTNLGHTPLYMRLFFGNTDQEKMCMSEAAVILAPDRQWQEIIFSMEQPGLICGTVESTDRKIQPATISVTDLKKNLNNIFFISLEDPTSDGKLVGTLGVDDIEALAPPSLEFVANSGNGKQLAIVDLHTDIITNSELLSHIINTPKLTRIEGKSLDYQLGKDGLLKVLSEGEIELLRPVGATLIAHNTAGVHYSDAGYKQLLTVNQRRITTFPQSNAESDFTQILQPLGLVLAHREQGDLAVFPQSGGRSGAWFSVRVDAVSTRLEDNVALGLSTQEYSDLKGVTKFIHNYQIGNDVYQQRYHAVPANWEMLREYLLMTLKATDVRLSAIGVISLSLNGTDYKARISPLVSPHEEGIVLPKKVVLQEFGDINQDGLPDFKVWYKNGQSQIIYLLP